MAARHGQSCRDIQRLIDRLPRTGGTVRLPAKRYLCTKSVVIDRDHVALLGSGPATVMVLGAHENRPVLVLGQASPHPTRFRRALRVANLSIDGNRSHQDRECATASCDQAGALRNNGITVRHATDVVIEHVTVARARSGGIVTELGSSRVTIRDVEVSDSFFDGIAGFATRDSRFTGLRLHDNLKAGLSFDGQFDNNTISNAVFTSNHDVGIFMRESLGNKFRGLQVRDSGSYGLFLAQGKAASTPAAGNAFSRMTVTRAGRNPALGGAGMRVNDASCVGNSLTDVHFVDNRDGGLSEPTLGLVRQSRVTTS